MNGLIKTFTQEDGTVAVDGRDLHDFLGVSTEYKDWFSRMAEHSLTENVDFVGFAQKRAKPQKNFSH